MMKSDHYRRNCPLQLQPSEHIASVLGMLGIFGILFINYFICGCTLVEVHNDCLTDLKSCSLSQMDRILV